jgi:hypothetical protein
MGREPLGPLHNGVALNLGFQAGRFPLENVEKHLLGSVRSMDLLDGLEQLKREIVAIAGEQVVGPAGQAIDHLRAAHFLRASPGIEITIALERQAMLLDAHVAHLHAGDELVHGKAFRPFERVKDFQPLGAADFG